MTDNTELQRLTRLGRQIAASCRRSRTRARLAVARVCARAARGGTEIHQQADIEKGGASSAAGGAAWRTTTDGLHSAHRYRRWSLIAAMN
jgi:hypothetical protein